MKYLFDEISLLKKRQIFSGKFCEVFKYTFFIKHLQATASDSESQVVCLDITTKSAKCYQLRQNYSKSRKFGKKASVAEICCIWTIVFAAHSNFVYDSETYGFLNLNCTYGILINFLLILINLYSIISKKTKFQNQYIKWH